MSIKGSEFGLVQEKYYLIVGSALFFFSFGVVELIEAANLYRIGHLYYAGGLTLGCVCLAASIFGPCSMRGDHWVMICLVVFAVSVFSTVTQLIDWNNINGVTACSIFDQNSFSTSCGSLIPDNYLCYGSSSEFTRAEQCSQGYQGGTNSATCLCVKQSSDDQCYIFRDISECTLLTNRIPSILLVCLIFSLAITLFSVIFAIAFTMALFYKGKWTSVASGNAGIAPTIVTARAPLPSSPAAADYTGMSESEKLYVQKMEEESVIYI
jgi:hypothetical protein